MSQQLQQWCEKLKKEVTEGKPMASQIRLMTGGEGTVWHTWLVADLEPADWAAEAEALVSALKTELPKRRVQLVFVAEDSGGAQMSNVLRSVTGENAQAQDLGTQNGAKALADAMASVGKLMDATLESARKHMQFMQETCDKQAAHLAEAHEVFMAIKKVELESEEQQSVASKIMIEQAQQAMPLLMQLFETWAKSPGKSTPSTLGGTAAAAAATNGAH